MAAASYDQLLRQVEVLKMENSNLRQELQDNSNHLTKLESEASNMKEVLKQLQGTIEEESSEAGSQLELIERLKEMSLDQGGYGAAKPRAKPPAGASLSSSSSSASSSSGATQGPLVTSFPRRGLPPGGRESHGYLEELEKERSLLLAELEKEEKEKDWYYTQLQNLTKRIDSLPLTENFSLQTDMSRRQLEFEARQIRGAMEEQLGSCQEMERRAQARVARIQQLENDMMRLGQHTHTEVEAGQGSTEGSGLAGAQASSSRLDQEPANEASLGAGYSVPRRITSHLGTKVEMVYSLLSMLGTHDKDDMSRTLLAMSSSQDSCIAMRQSGCLPLLIQLLHGNDKDSLLLGNSRGSKEARARASAALHNIVHSQPDDKRGRREIRVLHLLEQVRLYCETSWAWQENHERGVDQEENPMPSPVEHQICPAVCVLMKLSFDEEHRHAMNELGGLQAIGELLQVDCEVFGLTSDHYSVTLRRYAGMALTNLTFGDVANKATLCSMKGCMRAMVAQLKSESEDLQQVIASVLRNLSWRADVNSKKTLREVGSVGALMGCALDVQKESTLKSVLSALWNLSAHCTENKADICAVDGALAFLVGALTHRSLANTLAIIESGGGILRNVSSLIATNEAHRQILRENGCLPTLLQHLKSHSLTIVSNACGTLWNLSARNARDQEALWDMGAVGMLRNLIHSRHKMIAMGSAAALRNLMANRPTKYKDASIMSPGSSLPSLHARKQKALIEELDAQHLSETFDNIDNLSPKASHRGGGGGNKTQRHKQGGYGEYDGLSRSEGYGGGGGGSGGVPARSPYANTPVLSSPSSRGGGGGGSGERERRGPLRPSQDADGKRAAEVDGKRTAGIQIPSGGASDEIHSYSYKPSYTATAPKLEYRASSDSLNSVNSADGYGKRGQTKPSAADPYYLEDDPDVAKCCVYRKYPADLAFKIRSANHMEDDDEADLDTPINYSLKYSDEQLNSGRQSPSRVDEEEEEDEVVVEEDPAVARRSDRRLTRSRSPGYPLYPDGAGRSNDGDDSTAAAVAPVTSSYRRQPPPPPPRFVVPGDYGDDKPTNYGERYSEGERPDDQPIDYSLKYAAAAHKSLYTKVPASQAAPSKEQQRLSQDGSTSSLAANKRSQLRPSLGPARAATKSGACKVAGINQETLQTYCVEDTPICFSRGSSLSSLSSEDEDDGIGRKRNATSGSNDYPTLPISEKEAGDRRNQRAEKEPESPVVAAASSGQYGRSKRGGNHSHHHHKAPGEFASSSSGTRSPSKSGARTPKSPPEQHYVQETPLMFSRCTSVSSLDSFESPSIASSVQSEPCSGMPSGVISPSDLPDSPGQTMPPSRAKTPPLPAITTAPAPPAPPLPAPLQPTLAQAKRHEDPPPSKHAAMPPSHRHHHHHHHDEDDEDNAADGLLHFATESTPHGFSRASSLSALSLDEPYIPRESESKHVPTDTINNEDGAATTGQASQTLTGPGTKSMPSTPPPPPPPRAGDILDDSDDDNDIEILEECINSAMPKSSRKPKKQPAVPAAATTPPSASAARKPSQLPVYKLLPSQSRQHQRKTISSPPHAEEVPRVYCVEGTPLNFSTATSLSDLTIDSPPNELAPPPPFSSQQRRREGLPEGESTEEPDVPLPPPPAANAATATSSLTTTLDEDAGNEGDDILAECISAAMPKGRPRKPFRTLRGTAEPPPSQRLQHLHPSPAPSPVSLVQREVEKKKKPTSPVKPMPQRPYALPTSAALKDAKPGFAFDSPRHYTPIEGTPYCFSRNDSLSSLDFDDDEEVDLTALKEKAEPKRRDSEQGGRRSAKPPQLPPQQEAISVFPRTKAPDTAAASAPVLPDEKQKFAIEDTPVCFSRNSSLSSLSDIDQENNNKEFAPPPPDNVTPPPPATPPATSTTATAPPSHVESAAGPPRAASGYAPKAFHVEDTPVCFSRNSSLSSLSIDSEDDLLQECISSAMPKKKKQAPRGKGRDPPPPQSLPLPEKPEDGIMAEEPDLILIDANGRSPASPDSESFDWKAIQEGANSIVSSLNQAAAACLSRQPSSDSDSVLSLKSGLSVGSPFHLPSSNAAAEESETPPPPPTGGPRILKPGEPSTLEVKKKKEEEEESKALKGGKKVYRSLITGKPRPSTDTVAPLPRGRSKPSHQSVVSTSNSGSSPRMVKPPGRKSDGSPAREAAGVGGSSKTSSRSGSRDSTPSRPATNQNLTRQSSGRTMASGKLSQLPRTASPSAAKSSGSAARMSYPSPGRQAGQATPATQSGLPRSTSSAIPRSESTSRNSEPPRTSRLSGGGGSSESERSEKPGLVRQSTFIKEAPSPTLKRKLEESASLESLSPSSPSRTPVSSPSLPDMSLSLPFRSAPLPPSSSQQRRHEVNRSHSESPSRPPESSRFSRTGTWKRESGSKHSSSLPRVGTWKRTGSSSSILSASSESSEKGRSEDELLRPPSPDQKAALKGTWRKARDGGVDALQSETSNSAKSEDVWVRIEDCPVNNPRSAARSPAVNAPPVIDGVLAKMPPQPSSSSEPRPRPPLGSETNLNLLRSCESLDEKLPDGGGGGAVAARVSPFNYTPSPRKSVTEAPNAAAVTPNATATTNAAASTTPPRPSLIPTPVTNTPGAKKREPKGDGSGERGSYIVTSV
ncbi:adenomatous polyposis coli protein [Diretmus argenteus]